MHFKVLSYNICDFIKYRLPVLFINQNRLVDGFLSKTFHTICLQHRAVFSGFRWLGGGISNIKEIWYFLPTESRSVYKAHINWESTKYLRSLLSLIPIGVSLNNIKDKWFVNELQALKLQNHSVFDSNSILQYADNLIVGNTMSLSANGLFLSSCRSLIEHCIKKERLFFTLNDIEETFLSLYSSLIGDTAYLDDTIIFGYKNFIKKIFKYNKKIQNINIYVMLLKKALIHKKKKSNSIILNNDVNFVNTVNDYMIKRLNKYKFGLYHKLKLLKGMGTFTYLLKKAENNKNIRIQILIDRGYMEYIPKDVNEDNFLLSCFSLKPTGVYKNIYDFIEYILNLYVDFIKEYRYNFVKKINQSLLHVRQEYFLKNLVKK